MRRLKPREDNIQIALCQAMDYARIVYFHIPNGLIVSMLSEKERWRILSKLKKLGMKAGVPDLFIVSPPKDDPDWTGMFLELKREGEKLKPDQEVWRDKIIELGFGWRVAYGLNDAINILNELGYRVQ